MKLLNKASQKRPFLRPFIDFFNRLQGIQMELAIRDFFIFLIFFIILPSVYIIGLIKLIAGILNMENAWLKILLFLAIIIFLPIFVYIHMVIIYIAGGGH
jgi:hypothetical protein